MSIDFGGKQHRVLGVIPARGGSKRLPKKNILEVAGISLFGRSVIEAEKVTAIDHVICSTDDTNIADEAVRYGADVPFMRPAELATDDATSIDMMLHVVAEMSDFDVVVLLQPTSPFRTHCHVTDALRLFAGSMADSCVSVCPSVDDNLPKYWLRNNHLKIASHSMLTPDDAEFFSPNGAIYIASADLIKTKKSFYGVKCVPFFMSESESLDIDTPEDFEKFRRAAGSLDRQ